MCALCLKNHASDLTCKLPDKKWQYLLFAAEPYETIAFKVPSREVDSFDDNKFWSMWNKDTKEFFLQVLVGTKSSFCAVYSFIVKSIQFY